MSSAPTRFPGRTSSTCCSTIPVTRSSGSAGRPERSALFLRSRLRPDRSRYRYHALDMNGDMPDLLELLDAEQPAFIVNFAAQSEVAPSWVHPDHWFETNTVALAKLINHLRRPKWLERYVHISSPEVYGTCVGNVTEESPVNPSTPYASSKAAADMLLANYHQQFGLPLVSVRATNVYGARQQLFKIIPRSVIFMKLGKTIALHGGGVAVKSYIHIRDVSRGELAVMEQGRPGRIYHLSPDGGIAIRDLVRLIAERLGVRFEDATSMVEERPGQDAAYVIDSTRARRELGWALGSTSTRVWPRWSPGSKRYWDEIRRQPLDYQHKA